MDDVIISAQLAIPCAEIKVSFARSGGPGGQNVNKVESKVELRWNPAESSALAGLDADDRTSLLDRLADRTTTAGELVVTSQKTRDQARNRADAMAKLAEIVRAAAIRPTKRKPTRPSRAVRRRRLQDKKHRAGVKRMRQTPAKDD
ncbi:MAG: aminoacyl-tRNA hydrolase [Proteobacteria bacterium]|nr:aminoacyl-tRNA hydrolase [Pseudomonadota bacterium]